MKKRYLVLIIFILAVWFLQANIKLSEDNNEISSTKVFIKGNTIVYDGELLGSANEKVTVLYSKDIKRIVINSPGGEINLGLDLGEWIFDKKLDVEVGSMAFSSAANYILTAGNKKYIHENSFIGWHGGITQKMNFIDRVMMKIFNGDYLKKTKKRESDFFQKIGVDQSITTYGQKEEFKKYNGDEYVGWNYSLKAMGQLGVKKIVLIDGKWNIPIEREGKKIFTIKEVK